MTELELILNDIFQIKKEKVLFSSENSTFLVRVSLKDLWKSSSINGLQAESKAYPITVQNYAMEKEYLNV